MATKKAEEAKEKMEEVDAPKEKANPDGLTTGAGTDKVATSSQIVPSKSDKTKPTETKKEKPDMTNETAKAAEPIEDKKPISEAGIKMGENTITMPSNYMPMLGAVDPELASNALTSIYERTTRREDLIHSLRTSVRIRSQVSLYSKRDALVTLDCDTQWQRFYASNCRPRDFRLNRGPAIRVTEFKRELLDAYSIGMTIDVRKTASALRGEIDASREVADLLAGHTTESLIVWDLQAVFTVGFLLYFGVYDHAVYANTRREIRDIRNAVILHINVAVQERQAVLQAGARFKSALDGGYIILDGRYYNDRDLQVMQMISSGPRCQLISMNGGPHVTSVIRSAPIYWTIISNYARVTPNLEDPPITTNFLSFMRSLANDLRCETDMMKGYVRASSLYNGRIHYFEMPVCAPVNDPAGDVPNNRRDGDRPRFVQVDQPLNAPGPSAPSAQLVDAPPVAAAAKTPVKRNIKDEMREVFREIYLEYMAEHAPPIQEVAPPVVDECPRWLPLETNTPIKAEGAQLIAGPSANIMAEAIWVPASMELGGVELPTPTGSNPLWRFYRLFTENNVPDWAKEDLRAFHSFSNHDLSDTSTVLAACISMATSTVFHTLNLAGNDMRAWRRDQDTPANAFPILQDILVKNDFPRCILAESVVSNMNDMFEFVMNPNMYQISNFANAFRDWDEWGPNQGYALLYANTIPYEVHPLSIQFLYKAIPATLGIATPGIQVNLSKDISMYGAAEDRGWWSSYGCSDYKDAFGDDKCPYKFIPYGLAVINTVAQHHRWAVLPDIQLAEYGQVHNKGRYGGRNRGTDFEYYLEAHVIAFGQVKSYDWSTRTILAPIILTEDNHPHMMQQIAALDGREPDAGFLLAPSLKTDNPPTGMSVSKIPSLFKGYVPEAGPSAGSSSGAKPSEN